MPLQAKASIGWVSLSDDRIKSCLGPAPLPVAVSGRMVTDTLFSIPNEYLTSLLRRMFSEVRVAWLSSGEQFSRVFLMVDYAKSQGLGPTPRGIVLVVNEVTWRRVLVRVMFR